MLERRRFLAGLTGLICAPAIVRAASIMPVRPWIGDGVAFVSMAHPMSEWTITNLDYMIFMRARIEREFFQDVYVSRSA